MHITCTRIVKYSYTYVLFIDQCVYSIYRIWCRISSKKCYMCSYHNFERGCYVMFCVLVYRRMTGWNVLCFLFFISPLSKFDGVFVCFFTRSRFIPCYAISLAKVTCEWEILRACAFADVTRNVGDVSTYI